MKERRPVADETVTLGLKPSKFDGSSAKKLAQRRGDSTPGTMSKASAKARPAEKLD